MRHPVVLVALLLLTACGTGRSRQPTCQEMEATYVPPGLVRQERSLVGEPPQGVLVIYSDRTGGRELAVLSGVPSDPHATGTPRESVTVRGQEAQVFLLPDTDTWYATWLEAPVQEDCHQYTVTGIGLSEGEFRRVLAGIR